jgi:hypothetical protein
VIRLNPQFLRRRPGRQRVIVRARRRASADTPRGGTSTGVMPRIRRAAPVRLRRPKPRVALRRLPGDACGTDRSPRACRRSHAAWAEWHARTGDRGGAARANVVAAGDAITGPRRIPGEG